MVIALKIIGAVLIFLIVALLLAITIVPRFLDRIYYRGPASDHFDGARFFNPDGDADTVRVPTGGSRAGFFWNYFTGSDGRPPWPDSVAVTPGTPARRVDGERMVATWIGHATVLIQTHGLNILTDPVWARRAGPLGFGPTRVTRPGVAFDDLPPIDLVLLSHNHYDHLDLATLRRLWDRDRPRIVTSLGNDTILRSAGIARDAPDRLTALDWHQSTAIAPDVAVVVTRNHHWGSRWFSDRNRALWSSFVVRLPGGNLFFAGDSGMGDGRWPGEAAALGPVRLALIPIGAFRFVPGQMESGSHIGPLNAIRVFDRLGAARAIPIHWGTFRLSFEARDTPPNMLATALRLSGGDPATFAPVTIGAPVEIPAYAAPARRPDEARLESIATAPEITALP